MFEQNKKQTHIAILQERPMRLQEYGVGIFHTLSTKSALKKAIKKKLIFVDGKLGETSTFIYGNEVITFQPSEEKSTSRQFQRELEVVFEDEYLAIINKPPGILVSGNAFKTVANALAHNLQKSNLPDAIQPQPVHRLDYATTGLLVVGKTSTSLLALNKLFEHKKIAKTYKAITIGAMNEEGAITDTIDGKEAKSKFKVLKTVPSERFEYLNLVMLSPETGRRHQLRQHLATIGNPILGDATYGKEGAILKAKGLYLHAFSLEFIHPNTGKKMYIEKEIPSKFNSIF